MSPSRRVLSIALCVVAFAASAVVLPAAAQFYDPAVRVLDISTDPVGRSTRLLGMGQLSLTVDDPSYRFDLWDFAQNPLGIYENDSSSTAELWGNTGSASEMYVRPTIGTERQVLAGRASDVPLEIWHRSAKSHTAFGLVGRVQSLRLDTEAGADLERRRVVASPSVTPIVNARLPFFGGKLDYAVRAQFAGESVEERYRHYVTNPAGDFLDLDGLFANSPNFFTPRDYTVVKQGAGLGLGWKVAPKWKLAMMGDVVRNRIKGTADLTRSSSEISETRPYYLGQSTLIGRLGQLEIAADGHAWRASSEQAWRFSLSGGSGGIPLAGRGKLLDRTETGTSLITRVRLAKGPWTLGGSVNTAYSKLEISPPGLHDRTSLNSFLDRIYDRAGVDTLNLPDSVVASTTQRHAWGLGVGAGWTFKRGTAGAEFHWGRDIQDGTLTGSGPKKVAWDVRTGLEYRCNAVMVGRAGYLYRSTDDDEFLHGDEWIGHTITAGLGLRPATTSWSIEMGYALQLRAADFGDPTLPHSNRQNVTTQVRWEF